MQQQESAMLLTTVTGAASVRRPVSFAPPKRDSAPPHDAPTGSPPTDLSIRGLRVLVVDDDSDARELLEESLRAHGVVVETAESAPEGFEALQRFRPHVLVSDIGMPGEDGYSFMQRVRQLEEAAGGSTPAVAVTAFTRMEDRKRALAAGYSEHLGKPVDYDRLRSTIAQLGKLARP
jgi:CheY-like chemotaxis protein